MRLLIAADIFPPDTGGPATYSVALANELTALGFGVEIVSLNPNSDSSKVKCDLFAVKNGRKLERYWRYLYLLFSRGKKADLIYAMGPVNAGLPALIAARILGKKLVVKVVGDYAWEQGRQRFGVECGMDEFQTSKKNNWAVKFFKFLQSLVCARADLVIVPSQYLCDIVRGWSARPDKIKVIYNSANFQAVARAVKPGSEKWIVTAGRLVPWKGVGEIIEIMPNILAQEPQVKLKIVGDGPEMKSLQEKVASLNLSNQVDFLGQKPREEALSIIAAADVFILNSAYEGLSHVLLEARAFRVPILASNVGGNREVVPEGLFELNNKQEIVDKVLLALSQSKKDSDSNMDREFAERFSFSKMIKQTVESLTSL
jgi:glycosyltransferase involved in cell wall biosynthesis